MGRIQSSIGLITGTDIAGTVEQLIAISARPRDRLLARTEALQQQQQALAELTASVIGVQLAGNQLGGTSLFRSKQAASSNEDALTVSAGNAASPGTHTVRTIQKAETHSLRSLNRFERTDVPLGLVGTLNVRPAGFRLDESAELSSLRSGRGIEPGVIRITDRSGRAAEVDLSGARNINDVVDAINRADTGVRASTTVDAITLLDQTGSTAGNLKVEQVGPGETAADLGLWGINSPSDFVSGASIVRSEQTPALGGVLLSELNGGSGLGGLTALQISLSDGSSSSVDLSAAETTTEVIDLIAATGLDLIVGYNEAGNGFRIRDVSGGDGDLTINSSDQTAQSLGLEGSTSDDILVGNSLNRQSVTDQTLLADLNQGNGIDSGSFLIRDSAGATGAVNLRVDGVQTVGDLIQSINALGIGALAQLNDAGDGIAVIDTAAGSEPLVIEDTGSGTVAAQLGIAGTAQTQKVGGVVVPALVGSQGIQIEVNASDTLDMIVERINAQDRYVDAAVLANDDGTAALQLRSRKGGEAGRFAVNGTGVDLGLTTDVQGRDALIAVATDGGRERFLASSDGVFEIGASSPSKISAATRLDAILGAAETGSFLVTDSAGQTGAINLAVSQISTVGEMIDAINSLQINVTASVNDDGTGLAVVDTAGGNATMEIKDVGQGDVAGRLGLAGAATSQIVNGATVSALIGPKLSVESVQQQGLVVTLKGVTESPVTVTVSENPDDAVAAAQSFVDQYNLLVDKLESLTFFDPESNEVGLLFGSSEALRIRSSYSRLLSGRVQGAGEFQSVAQVGMTFDENGKLEFDAEKLRDAVTDEPAKVEDFFTTDETGLVARLDSLADRMAGVEDGLLLNRGETLSNRVESNFDRIESLNERLERERERLLRQFYSMEAAIARIQSQQSAIDQIRPVSIPT